MKTYKIWRSGGQTASIVAKSAFMAVKQFLKEREIYDRPTYLGGIAAGMNCAHYTAAQGDQIKVWMADPNDTP